MEDDFLIEHDFNFFELVSAAFVLVFTLKQAKIILLFFLLVGLVNGALNSFSVPLFSAVMKFSGDSLKYPLLLIAFSATLLFLIVFVLFIQVPQLFKGVCLRYNLWGIHKTGRGIDVSTSWKECINYKETRRFFFIFVKDGAQIVQKRKFKNNDEIKDFRNFISNKIRRSE